MKAAEAPADVRERAEQLRRAFDQSFALAPDSGVAATSTLIAIRVAGHPYAAHLADVGGIFVDKALTWLPGPAPELIGLVGVRGTVLPVYDLGMLLGSPKAAAARWLLVTAATPVGLVFDEFEGYLRTPAGAIVPEVHAEPRAAHVREVLHTEVVRAVIDLPTVLATIRSRSGPSS